MAQNPSIVNPSLPAAGLYKVTITDAGGLTATGSVQVAIHDPTPLTCNDNVTVSLDPQGQAIVLPQTVLQGNYDFTFYKAEVFNSQGLSQGDTLGCEHIGQSLTYRVTDICSGNSCWGLLKVQDKLPPKINCEDIYFTCGIENYSPEYLVNTLGIAAGIPTVTDNCGVFNLIHEDEFHNLPCAQPLNGLQVSSAWHRRNWLATDAAGNKKNCVQILYFVRRHLIDVQLPVDTIINCQNPSTDPAVTGAPYLIEYGHSFTLYPNNAFCEMNAGYSDEIIEVCDGTHKVLRTWTIAEDCPNTSEDDYRIHQQLITVMDAQGPTFTCPADVSVTVDPFTCCAIVDLPDVILKDNCSRINKIDATIQTFDIWTNDSTAAYGVNGTLTTFPNNNLWTPDTLGNFGVSPCLQQGEHTVTYRALDDCGNATTCAFNLVVRDKIPPIVACDSYTKVALGPAGIVEIDAETFDDGSYDRCCATKFYARRTDGHCFGTPFFLPSVWFCCSDIGDTVQVVFRAFDCAGNFNDCMVRVLVEDKLKPSCTAPANLTVDCAGFDPTLGSFGFATAVDNCCMDTILASVNYSQFDSVCNRGTILRTFRAIDCAGNSSQCQQKIVVDYRQYYYLKMPDDKIINACDGTGNYGEPSIHFEDCELIGISYEDDVFTVVPEGCYRIDRHWKIINWCTYNPDGLCVQIPNPDISQQRPFVLPGPIISPVNTDPPWSPTITLVNPTDPAPTNYSIFWFENANCYEYKQMILVFDTKDPIIDNCPQTPQKVCDLTANNGSLWNDAGWWDNQTASHDLCEGPADLTLTASDACTGSEIRFRYLLFLDLDNNGSMETVINSNNPPPAGMVYYNNAFSPNFSGGELRPFDLRPVPANQKYNFSIHETIVGNKRTAVVQWKTAAQLPQPGSLFGQPGIPPELPYGRHKIKWLVEDGCTNESFCEYLIDVNDCKKPTVVCLNGLSVNLPVGGVVPLWASDFLQYTNDNCTPTPQIKLGIRKSGTGTGFPLDNAGAPITGISFDCTEIGTQAVELWAMDLAGNADYCETFVIVQDNLGACGASGQVSGALRTINQEGVKEANVEIAGSSPFASAFTYFEISDNNGQYQFDAIPLASDFTLTPEKDDNPINGVTTFDLVEISKHILGVKPLGSPYKMIAADANRSNSITSFDIVELRKLILGVYDELPSNTSWRFVDKRFVFPNPANPFDTAFPENITVADFAMSQVTEDFVAVKIGDVNGSAISNAADAADDRSQMPAVVFAVDLSGQDQVHENETVTLKIQASELLQGFQFTLNYPGLELLELLPGENMRSDFFAVFPEQHALTVATDLGGKASFTLKYRVLAAGYLHQMLRIGSNITPAEAYRVQESNARTSVALQFPSPNRFEVYPVQPNPFMDKTSVSFFLPQAMEARLKLTAEDGRTLQTQKKTFPAGFNAFDVDLRGNNVSGVLYFKLETAQGNGSGKLIRVR